MPVIFLLLTPFLVGGAVLSGLATGGVLSRGLSNLNSSAERGTKWATGLTLAVLVFLAFATLATLLWTLPRVLAVGYLMFSVAVGGAVALVRELTPW